MKKYILIFTFLILTFCTVIAELTDGKWEIVYKLDIKVNGYGTSCYFNGIKSANNKDIIATANINEHSLHIIKSQDSGRTWKITLAEKIFDGTYFPFKSNAIALPDTNLAIVVCDSGSYWRSTDNGESWLQHFVENRKRIWQVDFWDNKTGIIFQSSNSTEGVTTEVRKTTDAGLTWFPIASPNPVHQIFATSYLFTKGNGIIYSIEIDNEVDSVYYFHKSTDYGETWQLPYRGPKIPPFGNFYFYNEKLGFCFGGQSLGNMQGYNKIIRRTTNGGLKWDKVLDTVIIPNDRISDIHFSDSLNGIAASITNIFRTSDGGKFWVKDTTYNYKKDPRISLIYLLDDYNAIGLSTNSDHNVVRYTAEKQTYIVDDYKVSRFEVFPNPAISYLNFDLPEEFNGEAEYSVFTIDGKEMQSGIATNKIAIGGLPTGSYYLILSKGDMILYSKFVKQ